MNFLKDFPINSLFFLFSTDKTSFLLTKITKKYMNFDEKDLSYSSNPLPLEKPLKKMNKFHENPLNIFSLYEKGVKLDTENFEKACPENLAKYIAKKVKKAGFSMIIDAFCGIGGNSIQVLLKSH